MNKAKNKLILYAVLVVFVLLTVLMGVLNGINFTMAADDADTITQELALHRGVFAAGFGGAPRPERGGRMGPMGPDSPEMAASLRYFTYAFDEETGVSEKIALSVSAISAEEAEAWARSLMHESTGWTRGTYRYRVYVAEGKTYVTVIDQGRELLPCYRILLISAIGEAVSLLLIFLFLLYAGGRLFAPLEDADRKQKLFITGMEKEFQVPLTVISADVELLERSGGVNEQTNSIRRQVKHMSSLLKSLGSLALFAPDTQFRTAVSLSELLQSELDLREQAFLARGLHTEAQIEPGVVLSANPEELKRLTGELLDNLRRYAVSRARVSLTREGERILLQLENDTPLPDGPCDQVFDRFATLENAVEGSKGLGLSTVKSIVQHYNGRARAAVEDGVFRLRISL